MNKQIILEEVERQIRNSENGMQSEHPKFDFKSKWYNLKEKKKDYYEFLKDSCAMANTFGDDGIIAIGYDDKKLIYNPSKVKTSGLSETLEIYKLLGKNIIEMFDLNIYEEEINGHLMTILHFPPSINKPHVIKEYKRNWKDGQHPIIERQKIFVRKDTGTFEGTKYDIDRMYYDRKNISPDYLVAIDSTKIDFKNFQGQQKTQFVIFFSIENLGTRPLAIVDILLQVKIGSEVYDFELEGRVSKIGIIGHSVNNLIIKKGEIVFIQEFIFSTKGTINSITRNEFIHQSELYAILKLTNGKLISVRINHDS